MTRHRWKIPMVLAVVLVALGIASVVLSREGQLRQMEHLFEVGQTHGWQDVPLQANQRYTLRVGALAPLALNDEALVSAALSKDDVTVFELEDAYWHLRGTWREGGQSGTWDEANVFTDFSFVVPEDGNYDFEISLEGALGGASKPLGAVLIWRKPWFLSAWPLFSGALLLLALAVGGHVSRRWATAKLLQRVGVGSVVRIDDADFEVVGRAEHWEDYELAGVDLRLRSPDGREEWISTGKFWWENEESETEGMTTLVLRDIPLTDEQCETLERESGQRHFQLGPDRFWRDPENCGPGLMASERNGEIYVTKYVADLFRHPDRLPKSPGEKWLERMKWSGGAEDEWALMEVVETDDLELPKFVAARRLQYHEIEQAGSTKDPFGVAGLRRGAPAVAKQGEEEPESREEPARRGNDW